MEPITTALFGTFLAIMAGLLLKLAAECIMDDSQGESIVEKAARKNGRPWK